MAKNIQNLKGKIKPNSLDASCIAIIQCTLPQKEKDSERVMLPVTIGSMNVGKALIDLVSSINLIP